MGKSLRGIEMCVNVNMYACNELVVSAVNVNKVLSVKME